MQHMFLLQYHTSRNNTILLSQPCGNCSEWYCKWETGYLWCLPRRHVPPCQLEFTAKGYIKQNPCAPLSAIFSHITSALLAVICFMTWIADFLFQTHNITKRKKIIQSLIIYFIMSVEVLCYKPEGSRIESRWGGFFSVDLFLPATLWPWGRLSL
jgi:hypothetical protein